VAAKKSKRSQTGRKTAPQTEQTATAPNEGKDAATGRFVPGNKIGNRFKPGESGNPLGVPPGKRHIRETLNALLRGKPVPEALKAFAVEGADFESAMLMAWVMRSMQKGGGAYANLIADRMHGKEPLPIRLGARGEDESRTDLRVTVVTGGDTLVLAQKTQRKVQSGHDDGQGDRA